MSTISCPHCGQNASTAPFCEHCGMALPSPFPTVPHIVSDVSFIQNDATRALFSDELRKKVKSASTCLLVVGILNFAYAGILFGLARNLNNPEVFNSLIVTVLILGTLGLIFVGLYFWCRTAPLPATLTGFFIYLTMLIANVVILNANRKPSEGSRGGCGIGLIDFLILGFLIAGVKASLDIREMNKRNRSANVPPVPPTLS